MAIVYGVICILPLLFISCYAQAPQQAKDVTTNFPGSWELLTDNSGVSAMHLILLPKISKALMYDATIWRISKIALPPEKMPCRVANHVTGELDCWAHAVLLDYDTGKLTALKITTDTWCSSGGLTVEGDFVGIGGFKEGATTTRYLTSCETCDWREYPNTLASARWYATQVTLPDANFLVFGGRGSYDYELIPPEGATSKNAIFFPLLKETHDRLPNVQPPLVDDSIENNLYPFVHLAPDGNLFIFANNRSIMFNPKTSQVLREFPALPGGSRNYPASGMSVLLPIQLKLGKLKKINAEVLICGGAPWDSFYYAEKLKKFLPALQECGRIQILKADAFWKIEKMPSPRVMGDMMILPTGDVLMVNGAKTGTSAWNDAEEPNLNPVLYSPKGPRGLRFRELAPSNIPRMYHSVAGVLPDGKVLVAGSNTHDGYQYNAKYPTELRVEKFSPPYLDPAVAGFRQQILVETSDKLLKYGENFSIKIKSTEPILDQKLLKVTMYAPPFTTHGISMSQRLLMLAIAQVLPDVAPGVLNIMAGAPKSAELAPPGYYLLSVVYRGVPSVSIWVQIK